ncbi:MAG: zinc-ribbon domain-containing protein, partial [Rhizobium giardinii]
MRLYECGNCGTPVHFDNRVCINCGSRLGFLPEAMAIQAVTPAGGDLWRVSSRQE